jgi:2-polyprenyl-6-methoxyphenol hydroxylase-like FAD-dependent oxidoreductase
MTAALKAGVSIEIGLTVSRFEQRPGHVRLFYQDTLEHESPLGDFAALVLADGTRSTLRRQMNVRQWVKPYPWGALWSVIPTPIGSDSTDLRQWYRRCAEMFGIMPTGSTHQARTTKLSSLFWSLPVASYDQWREEGVDGWRARVCALAGDAAQPFLQQVNNLEQLMMAVYADVRMQCWNDGRVLAIGDCAHAMSPQLGQGANMALVDASVLAQALEGAEPQEPNWPDVLSAYGELRRQHLRYYRQASRLLTPLFQSHSTPLAWLRDSALFLARHNAFGRKHAVTTLVCARTSWFFLSRQDRALYQWNGQQSETSLREDTKIDVS